MNSFKKFLREVFFKTYARTFLTIYLLFALIGGLILWLPFAQKAGNPNIGFLNAFFVSISAMSTTGLTPVVLTETFNIFGYIVIMFIMEIGGLGIYLLFANFLAVTKAKISVSERAKLASEQNLYTVRGIIRKMRTVLIAILFFQLITTIYFFFDFYFGQSLSINGIKTNVWNCLLQASFLSVSTFMNAGFTILNDANAINVMFINGRYFTLIVCMISIFLGGVGYLPITEVIEYIRAKIKKKEYKISFISKLLFNAHFGLMILGTIVLFTAEYNNIMANYNYEDSLFIAMFTSISARSAGFSIIDSVHLTTGFSRVFMLTLMVIGASPNSAGGGIRTTTFILIISNINSFAQNKEQILIGRTHAIKEKSVNKSLTALSILLLILLFSTFGISIFQSEFDLSDIIFELSSAFGTVGYSIGITEKANVITKLILIFVMFIGRISLVTFMNAFIKTQRKPTFKYKELELMVS